MHLDEISVDRMTVEGFPELSVIEPTLEGLAELAEKFSAFDPRTDADAAGAAVVWLFEHFVRDAEGLPIEGASTPAEALRVPRAVLRAITNTINPVARDEDPS